MVEGVTWSRPPGDRAGLVQRARVALVDRPTARNAAWIATAAAFLIIAFKLFLSRPVPVGVLLFGLVIGSINALIAVGLILVYRANRIVNFAQAEVGIFGAILFENLARDWSIPWPVAVVAGVAAAGALGGLVEMLIMRRFATAPRLIVTVATIGVAQIVVVLTYGLAQLFGEVAVGGEFRTPLSSSGVTVTGVRLSGDALLLLAAVPVVVVALDRFLRRTDFGVAVRASAESGERAGLLGVPVRRVTTTLWVVAAAFAGLATILRAPVIGLISGSSLQGPEVLLRALAAAVLAKMDDLRIAVVAALGLGVVEYAIVYAEAGSTISNVVFVAVIVVGCILQRRDGFRFAEGAASAWAAIEEVRPVPGVLRRLPEVAFARRGLLVAVAAALGLFAVTASPSAANLGAAMAVYGIIAVSLVVLTGWAGQISLGHFGIAGFGAAAGAKLYADAGWDFIASIFAGGVAAALVSLLLGTVALRVRGFFFAVASLGFAVAVQSFFLNPNFFNGLLPENRPERPYLLGRWDLNDERAYFIFSVVVLALVAFAAGRLRRSRTGRVLIAVRDNDRAAASYGVNPTQAKLLAFAVSGFIAGMGGVVLAIHQHAVSASAYSANESLRAFTMVVIGGLGSLPGALVGAVYVRGASFFLSDTMAILATGVGLLGVLLVLPGGLGRVLYAARDSYLRRVANRRGIHVPSLVRDDRVDDVAADDAAAAEGLEHVAELDVVPA